MASTFASKLRLTAAALGCRTRKELCARFRAVNPATAFDLDRSHKWLQGVALPRSPSVYEDWRRLLGTAQPAGWLASCSVDAFTHELCALFAADRAELEARAAAFGRPGRAAALDETPPASPRDHRCGAFVAYSWAMSPWYSDRLIRGVLRLQPARAGRHHAVYQEVMPDGLLRLEGAATLVGRMVYADLGCDPAFGYGRFYLALLSPGRPVDAMIGDLMGATVLGSEPQPVSTPIVLLRVDAAGAAAALARECYLPPDAEPLEADLAALSVAGGRRSALAAATLAFLARERRGAAQSTTEALAAIATCLLDDAPSDGLPGVVGSAPLIRRLPAARSA